MINRNKSNYDYATIKKIGSFFPTTSYIDNILAENEKIYNILDIEIRIEKTNEYVSICEIDFYKKYKRFK